MNFEFCSPRRKLRRQSVSFHQVPGLGWWSCRLRSGSSNAWALRTGPDANWLLGFLQPLSPYRSVKEQRTANIASSANRHALPRKTAHAFFKCEYWTKSGQGCQEPAKKFVENVSSRLIAAACDAIHRSGYKLWGVPF
jgi:hypothetical protein